MIRRLQRQFVAIAMVSLLFIIVAIVCAINGFNLRQINITADSILELLAGNNGVFPDADSSGLVSSPNSDLVLTPESRFETRYFVVYVDEAGAISGVLIDNIASTTVEEASEYATQVINSGKSSGYVKNYRYLDTVGENGRMVIFLDRQAQLRSLEVMMQLSVVVGAVALLVMFVLVYYLSRRAIRPVVESVEKQKRFITDAGHELKTPLAIISADTEVLELSGGDNQWTTSIRNQIKRLNTLVADLLTLSKLEEYQSRQSFREFSLSDTVTEVAEGFSTMAEAQEKQIQLQVCPEVTLRGDENAIRKMVSVLIDNAVKYTVVGGEITVSLFRRGKNPCLQIVNPSESLPEGDLNLLFERFYRADASRARGTGGYGVGLSIAKAVAEAHRAKISAQIVEDNKMAFTVLFSR